MGVDFGFQNKMMQMIDDLGIKEKIHIIKNPSRDDVIAAYKESEFLVLPSRWELSPLVPLEGFAFKKTIISTDTDGIPHTVKNNINGLLFQPENFQELAKYDDIEREIKDLALQNAQLYTMKTFPRTFAWSPFILSGNNN